MKLFEKIFGKKQIENHSVKENSLKPIEWKERQSISNGNGIGYKIVRHLTDDQREAIEQSTIFLRTGQLFMHYWSDNLKSTDRNDQEWQNKVMFFWRADEPFPNKSLPPSFENLKEKHFLFQGHTEKISVQSGQVVPWFGIPGLGEKYVCEIDGERVTIPELYDQGNIEYVERTELTDSNLHILKDKESYSFLIDEKLTPFHNGNFYLDERPIPIHIAYSVGGIQIIGKPDLL